MSKPGVKINFALNLQNLKNEPLESFHKKKKDSPKPIVLLPMEKLQMHSLMDQQKKYQTYEDIMKDDEAGHGLDIRQTHRK